MPVHWTYFIPVVIVSTTTLGLLLSQNWRTSLLVLVAQYLAVFWMITSVWSIGLAAVKLVTGFTAVTMLAILQPDPLQRKGILKTTSPRGFVIVSAGLGFTLAILISLTIKDWFPINIAMRMGGFILIAMSLLQLGMTNQFFRLILGLLTLLSGFEVLYAGLENSVLVTGLLSILTIGLALVGAYLIAQIVPGEET